MAMSCRTDNNQSTPPRMLNLPFIGDGSHSEVYDGGEFRNKQIVLKVFRDDKEIQYLQELKAFKRIHSNGIGHRNIVPFFGEEEIMGHRSITLERINRTLLESIKEHEYASKSVRFSQLLGIADGVLFLHSVGVIHRDLKSDNILLRGNNEALISDFSLAHISSPDTRRTWFSRFSYYAAPEASLSFDNQKDEIEQEKIDAYGLGLIVREVCYENTSHDFMKTWDYIDSFQRVVGRSEFKYHLKDKSGKYQHRTGCVSLDDDRCRSYSPFFSKTAKDYMCTYVIHPAMEVLPWNRISVHEVKERIEMACEHFKGKPAS